MITENALKVLILLMFLVTEETLNKHIILHQFRVYF